MKERYLIVDGYNIIFAWQNLKDLAGESLEDARACLLDTLCNYQGFNNIQVIVVFDGFWVKGNSGSNFIHNNISVVFTSEGETADGYIERFVGSLPKEAHIRVATSDNLEQIMILGRGALRMSARELWLEINDTEKNIRQIINNKPPKNNMLSDNLDEPTRKWIEEMRRKK